MKIYYLIHTASAMLESETAENAEQVLEQALELCEKSDYENDLLTRDYLDIGNIFFKITLTSTCSLPIFFLYPGANTKTLINF